LIQPKSGELFNQYSVLAINEGTRILQATDKFNNKLGQYWLFYLMESSSFIEHTMDSGI
jgi:hypothetical protein